MTPLAARVAAELADLAEAAHRPPAVEPCPADCPHARALRARLPELREWPERPCVLLGPVEALVFEAPTGTAAPSRLPLPAALVAALDPEPPRTHAKRAKSFSFGPGSVGARVIETLRASGPLGVAEIARAVPGVAYNTLTATVSTLVAARVLTATGTRPRTYALAESTPPQ